MAEYQARFFTRAGVAGPLVAVVPAYERGLNGTGQCTFTVSLDLPALADPASSKPWANEVLLLRRESSATSWTAASVAHDGPIIKRDFDDDAGTMTLTVGTVSAWLARRNQRETVDIAYGTPTDLDTIAGGLIYLSQYLEPPYTYNAAADYLAGFATTPTGTTRTYALRWDQRRNWLEALNELAGGSPSFDWDFVTTWSGGVRTRIWRSYSPARGSVITTPLIRGRGMVGLKVIDDGERAANRVESFGSGGTATSEVAESSGSQTTDGLLEFFDANTDIEAATRLADRAAEQLRIRLPPARVAEVGYVVGQNLPWRFATIGDTVTVTASRGPMVVSGSNRIANERVSVSDGGMETVMFTMQDPL